MCVKNELTVSEIARRLEISPQALSQKIKRGTMSLGDLEEIAIVSGCKLECSFVLAGGERIAIVKAEGIDD